MMNLQLQYAGKTYIIQQQHPSLESLKKHIQLKIGLPFEFQKLYLNSKKIQSHSYDPRILQNQTIKMRLGLVGGKGGFGAKMKNQGSKKNKGNSTKFSRDLSGKRLDYANIRKDYIDLYKKKLQQDAHVEEQRKKYKIMQQTMNQQNKSGRVDRKHKQQLQQKSNSIIQSIKIGIVNKLKAKEDKSKDNKQIDETKQKQQKQKIQQDKQQSVNESFSDDNQKQDQEPKVQGKRKRVNDSLTKQDQTVINQQPIKLAKTQIEPQKPKFVFTSAADRLKSLFKK